MSETPPADVVDMTKIGLRPRETHVLRAAVRAWSLGGNGHYLCGTGQYRAAERLINPGFLTKVEVDPKLSPLDRSRHHAGERGGAA